MDSAVEPPPRGIAAHSTLDRVAPGRYGRRIDRTWWGYGSLFGGYAMALAAVAIEAEAGPDRHLRAITMHFLRPFLDGEFAAEVTVERSGRTVTSLSARLLSQGRLCGVALATCTVERHAPEFDGARRPPVAPPEDAAATDFTPVAAQTHFRMWPRFGQTGPEGIAEAGGWVVPVEPEPWTPGLLLAVGDVWLPSVHAHLKEPAAAMSSDFTGHVRVPTPQARVAPGTPVLVRFRTRRSVHGFADEDTEIWAPDGELLATTRQLRFIQPRPGA